VRAAVLGKEVQPLYYLDDQLATGIKGTHSVVEPKVAGCIATSFIDCGVPQPV